MLNNTKPYAPAKGQRNQHNCVDNEVDQYYARSENF